MERRDAILRDAILIEESPKRAVGPSREKKRHRGGRGARYTTTEAGTARSVTIVSPTGDLSAVEARLFGRS